MHFLQIIDLHMLLHHYLVRILMMVVLVLMNKYKLIATDFDDTLLKGLFKFLQPLEIIPISPYSFVITFKSISNLGSSFGKSSGNNFGKF